MIEPWKKLSEKEEKVGYRTIVQRMYQMPNESEALYSLAAGGSVVCVLAVTKDNTVILAKQFRPGPETVYDELPGGVVEHGEDECGACARELLEETGYSGNIEPVAVIPKCGYSCGFRHCFVATECEKVAEPNFDELEFIEVVEKSVEDFVDQARKGQMTDVDVAWLGLDYLGLIK
jgi:ADP-ribose pyrophosphatase